VAKAESRETCRACQVIGLKVQTSAIRTQPARATPPAEARPAIRVAWA